MDFLFLYFWFYTQPAFSLQLLQKTPLQVISKNFSKVFRLAILQNTSRSLFPYTVSVTISVHDFSLSVEIVVLGTLFKVTVFYACFCLKIEKGLIDPNFRVLVYLDSAIKEQNFLGNGHLLHDKRNIFIESRCLIVSR